jgi:diphthamide synthase subunit DPH2
MSFRSSEWLPLITCLAFFYSSQCIAEIYQWVDSQGRVQFSDSSSEEYHSAGYAHSVDKTVFSKNSQFQTLKDLNNIAKELKKDRLNREKIRAKAKQERMNHNKKRKKQSAAAKKRKRACEKARVQQNIAFRKRTQYQGLIQMRKALVNYERKRDVRQKKCRY